MQILRVCLISTYPDYYGLDTAMLRGSECTVTRSKHSYISVNTVPFYSLCAVLLIATLILICQIPLGTYH